MPHYMMVSFKTCPWVQRSAIILREKNTPFEFRHIESDNRPDWFLAISPHKKVPVLRIDDKVTLFESNAINEYLDEVDQPRLDRLRADLCRERHRLRLCRHRGRLRKGGRQDPGHLRPAGEGAGEAGQRPVLQRQDL